MPHSPLVLGINRTQDASICLMQGSRLVWAIQKERLSRQKHHWGRTGDLANVYLPNLPGLGQPVDVLVECYSCDAEFEKLASYESEIAASLVFAPGHRRARMSHHLAHVYSAFHPSPFREAAVMIIDGQGSAVADLTESWSGAAELPGDWREVSSFYHADRERISCIGKQTWDRNEMRPTGLGMFYFLLTQAIFPGEGNEGKVMGLAPYGKVSALGLPPLEVREGQVSMPARWRDILGERLRFRFGGVDDGRFTDIANLAAAGQHAFEEALLSVARWLHARTGAENLCFAGGTALNCSANERLLHETPFRRVFIPPAPSDAGTAIGCALYGLTELAGQACEFRWTHDYLGPAQGEADIAAALADAPDLVIERLADTALCEQIVERLCSAQVVGLYQGRSEFGPRALGHRSILGDPRHENMRDGINAKVKQREWFRPLAPVVLLEKADAYFDVCRPVPFMQFAAPVRPAVATRIPAVTHVDGTARLQTVGPDDDPFLRKLLLAFEAHTGVPVLLNTSFNRKEEPIVETPAQAVDTFRRTPMHALAMPPFLVHKRDPMPPLD